MEIIKDIATVIGLVLSAITLITLCCKPLRRKIGNMIRKTSNIEETSEALEEVRAMMQQMVATQEVNQELMAHFQESQLSLLRDEYRVKSIRQCFHKMIDPTGSAGLLQLYGLQFRHLRRGAGPRGRAP